MKNNTKSGGFLSIIGLLVASIVVFLLPIADQFLWTFGEISILHLFSLLVFLILGGVMGGVYGIFYKGGENTFTAFILAVVANFIYRLGYYIALIITMMVVNGMMAVELREFTFTYFLKMEYLVGPEYFFGIELTGIAVILYNIVGFLIMFFVIKGILSDKGGRKAKQLRRSQVQSDFLARNVGADISNPLVQARMWTERALLSQEGINPDVLSMMTKPFPQLTNEMAETTDTPESQEAESAGADSVGVNPNKEEIQSLHVGSAPAQNGEAPCFVEEVSKEAETEKPKKMQTKSTQVPLASSPTVAPMKTEKTDEPFRYHSPDASPFSGDMGGVEASKVEDKAADETVLSSEPQVRENRDMWDMMSGETPVMDALLHKDDAPNTEKTEEGGGADESK